MYNSYLVIDFINVDVTSFEKYDEENNLISQQ